jgi:hypothetical protein
MNYKQVFEKIDILTLSGIAFFILCLTSIPLWFSIHPTIPRCPIIGEATYSELWCQFDFVLCVTTFAILGIGLGSKNRKLVVIGILFLVINCLTDINRFNAVSYFFICLWILWLLNSEKALFLNTLLIFLTGIYFWSGWNKWNIHFYTESYQWLMNLSPISRFLVEKKWFSYILPALEIIPAWILLIPKARKWGIAVLLTMHIYIIYLMTIVEWGKGIIVWNITMMVLLILLWNFREKPSNFFRKKNLFSIFFLSVVSFLLPLMFCFDIVSAELGYSMYCGRYTSGNMAFTATDKSKLDKKYYPYLMPYQEFFILDLDYFGFKTYEAELCRTEFTYKKMFQKLSEPFSDSCMLVIVRKPMFSIEEYEYIYKE